VTVYLVGAGPGDPGLLTVRGAEVLRRADVVIYDRLSAPSLLDLAPATAERIYVGKRGSEPSTPQERINELLVEHGRTAAVVVRLKGGDPFVFARGAEELTALREAGIRAEVVPGITSAIAAPAYAGIPVTRRYSSTSFTVVTGHEDPTKDRSDVDWDAIAKVGGTIVVLMGVANIAEIARRLVDGGLAPDTPASAVQWGTRPDQRTVRATLGTIADRELAAPSVIVVGDVAADDLGWFTDRPLFGHTIVVTRAPEQASRLTDSLAARGAAVVNLPTIAIAEADDGGAALAGAAHRVADYEWVVLTSPNGAERFLDAVGDARSLAGVGLAVVGPGTAAVLEQRFLRADLVPERYVAEGLIEAFPAPRGNGRVLLPQAADARPVLAEGLRTAGWEVDVVVAYRTVAAAPDPSLAGSVAGADAVAFASSSAVANFVAAVPADGRPSCALCIGPVTAATARDAGFGTVIVADEHDIDGLVAAAERWVASDRPA
jgi:uroporphyrinogen III methyltransferase/synthase